MGERSGSTGLGRGSAAWSKDPPTCHLCPSEARVYVCGERGHLGQFTAPLGHSPLASHSGEVSGGQRWDDAGSRVAMRSHYTRLQSSEAPHLLGVSRAPSRGDRTAFQAWTCVWVLRVRGTGLGSLCSPGALVLVLELGVLVLLLTQLQKRSCGVWGPGSPGGCLLEKVQGPLGVPRAGYRGSAGRWRPLAAVAREEEWISRALLFLPPPQIQLCLSPPKTLNSLLTRNSSLFLGNLGLGT